MAVLRYRTTVRALLAALLAALALGLLGLALWTERTGGSSVAVADRRSVVRLEPEATSLDGLLPDAARAARREALSARAAPARAPGETTAAPPAVEIEHFPLDVRVVTPRGEPVSGVTFRVRGPEAHTLEQGVESEPGRYRLLLPEGRFGLLPSASDPPAVSADPYETMVAIPYEGPPLLFVLTPPAGLLATVIDESGEPVAGAAVELRAESSDFRLVATSSDEGRVAWEALPVGPAVVTAARGLGAAYATVELGSGETASVTLTLPAGGWILVRVFDEDGSERTEVPVLVMLEHQILNAKSGERYGPLAPAEYLVAAVFDETAGAGPRILTDTVTVVAGEERELALAVPATRVVVEGTVTTASGPWSGGILLAFLEGHALVDGIQILQCDPAGRYRLELGQPSGVVFAVGNSQLRVVSHLARTSEARVVHPIRLESASVAGRVAGAVEGETWKVLVEPQRRAIELALPGGDSARFRKAEADGSFRVEALDPGGYRLWARRDGGGLAGPVSVELAAGVPTEGVELARSPTGAVRGRVRSADGTAVAGALVQPLGPRGAYPFFARSDAAGSFRLDDLPAGALTVWAQSAEAVGSVEVSVTTGETADALVTLARGARIHVAACDASGEPCPAILRAFAADGRELSALRGPREAADSFLARVSSSERTFGPLPPGTYEVLAESLAGHVVSRSVALGESDVTLVLRP